MSRYTHSANNLFSSNKIEKKFSRQPSKWASSIRFRTAWISYIGTNSLSLSKKKWVEIQYIRVLQLKEEFSKLTSSLPYCWTYHQGLGRIALIACVLSSMLTAHTLVLCLLGMERIGILQFDSSIHNILSSERSQIILQWIMYTIAICIFHLAEFFVTAMYNPSVVKASSFIINHSKSYTIAMTVSDWNSRRIIKMMYWG